MNQLNELLQKRNALVVQGREISEKAVKEKRAMTSEETVNFDKIFAEITSLDETRKRVEQQIEAERTIAKTFDQEEERAGKKTAADEKRMEAFRAFLMTGERRALQSDIDANGGFLKGPQTFVASILQAVDDMLFIRQKATVMRVTSGDSLGQPTLQADPSNATWTAEIAAAPADSAMAFGKRELKPHRLAKLLQISRPLLRMSAIPVDQLIAQRLAYRLAVPQEAAFMTGTGAGQPLGLFTASAQGISTGRDVSTGNTSSDLTFDGLIEVKYAVKSQYWNKAEWIFHRDGIKHVAKLKDTTGQYIWQPSKTVGEPDTILGNPANSSEYAPNTFSTGLYVGIFGDLSQYHIADSLDFELQRLDELYAATNQVGFIARAEVDGMPVMEEAFARVKLA